MSKRKEILKQIGVYSFGTQATQMITLIAAILSRRFLGPMQMGIWTTLQILVDYSKYASMGLMDAVSREIPYWNGKGEPQRADQVKNLAFSVVTSLSFLIACGILLFAVLTRGRFSPEVSNGLFLVSGIIFLQRMNNLLIALLRCYKKFTLEAGMMFWSAVVNAVLVAVLAYFFKIYGFICALGLSFVFNIGYILLKHDFGFKWEFERERLKGLMGYGLPLMFLGMFVMLFRSIDKIMLAKFAGFESLGHYSIALMVCSYISNFSISIGIVLLPHIQEKYGRTDDPKDLKEYLFKSSTAYALTVPALIGSAWMLAPYGVSVFLPKYVAGLSAMKALSLSMLFIAWAQPYHDFLITLKKHYFLFPLIGFSGILAVTLDYAAIRGGHGILGVGAVTSFVFLFNFTTIYFFASRYFADLKTAIKNYLSLIGYCLYFLGALSVICRLLPENSLSLRQTLLRMTLFAVFYLPFLWVINRRFLKTPAE